jgi:hypothetical protein
LRQWTYCTAWKFLGSGSLHDRKNVYLMGPDRAGVIEGKREIEEKKGFLDPKPTALTDSSPSMIQVGINPADFPWLL